nr:nucleotide-binding, alpha-beta plait [Tanacetum cinerariifolium]
PSITSSFAANYAVGSPSIPEARQAQLLELTAQLSVLGFQVSPIAPSGPQAFYGVRPSNNYKNNNNNNRWQSQQLSWEYTLKTQLLRIEMHVDETLDAYLNHAQEYADALTAISEPVKDKDLVMLADLANWHSNTEANSHVTPDLEAMDNSEAYYGDDALHVDNGKGLPILHIGSSKVYSP